VSYSLHIENIIHSELRKLSYVNYYIGKLGNWTARSSWFRRVNIIVHGIVCSRASSTSCGVCGWSGRDWKMLQVEEYSVPSASSKVTKSFTEKASTSTCLVNTGMSGSCNRNVTCGEELL